MNEFIKSFGYYWKEAQFGSIWFWVFPVATIMAIWLLTIAGLKVFSKRTKLKTIFVINRAWIVNALIVATVLIGLICFWWSQNFFAQHPYQFSLLISLIIAMAVPIAALLNLRNYYTQEKVKDITDLPKTQNQLYETITFTKKAFGANKWYFLVPILGFLLLFFYLNKGKNLISIIFDNSISMGGADAINALSETFEKLDENNEVMLTTLNGYGEHENDPKMTIKAIMATGQSARLKAGRVNSYSTPQEAKGGLERIDTVKNSPISESTWKTYLFAKETKANTEYKTRLLIIMTDGDDRWVQESIASKDFFFDDVGFAEYFTPDHVFVINFAGGKTFPLVQKFADAGCDVIPAENNKQAYLDALDNTLQSFKNSWFLIDWTIIIFSVFAVIGLMIPPKKIA